MKKVKMCIICSIIIFTIFSLKNVVFAFDIFIDNFTGFSPARKLDNSDISFIEMLNREQEEWAVYTSGGGIL